jgi:hypothetical protein
MQPDHDQTAPRLKTRQRVTVQEAARLLDTTVEGVRSRIKRGTLAKEKDEDGAVYVLLDADQASPGSDWAADQTTDRAAAQKTRTDELIAELRSQNEHLRNELFIRNEELKRKDTILMTMAQRIPELEPAQGRPESHVTGPETPDRTEDKAKAEKRSFWQRLLGG